MLKSVKQWLRKWRLGRKIRHDEGTAYALNQPYTTGLEAPLAQDDFPEPQLFTLEQVKKIAEEYGDIRYNDGKRVGIGIAREQATKSLKEILEWQNKTK